MSFECTYIIKRGPSATSVEKYASDTNGKFLRLIESNPIESDVQSFLERNPALVPGAGTPGVPWKHAPLFRILITQPKLPGLSSKYPDFLWFPFHSKAWYPTLIEIERPGKRIFTSRGIPTAQFTEARNQLAQWRTWFNDPANVQKLISDYGIPDEITQYSSMKLHMILVYGRRSECRSNPVLSKQQSSLLPGHDEELVSYDRLQVETDLRDVITVRALGSGMYRAVALPPTFTLGPSHAQRLSRIRKLESVIQQSPIAKERIDFLLRRLPYWLKWAGKGDCGTINTGDHE